MELIDSASNIDRVTPKLIEFPKHFIVNTQLYDKQTLKPVPFKFFVSNAWVPFMLLQSYIVKTSYYYDQYRFDPIQNNNEHNKQSIIQDKNDPSIFYIIQNIYKSGSEEDEQMIHKVQYNENTKQYIILNSWDISNAGNDYNHKGDIKILHETDDYFVLSVKTNYYGHTNHGNAYSMGAIILLNKKTFAYTRVYGSGSYENTFSNFLLKAENDVVYILTHQNLSTKQIIKVNTSSKIATVIWTETPTSNTGCANCNPVQIGDYYYVLTPYLENTLHSYKITKFSLDTITDTVNTEEIDINLNGYTLDNSPNQNMAYSHYIYYTLRLIQSNSDTYLSLLMHTAPNIPESWDYQTKHVLLKMNGNSFDVVDLIQLRDGCYGSLENGDSKHQLWWAKNCVLFYVFDETKEKMVCTYKKPGMFMQIGFDSLNRFITQTSEQTVEILTDINACTLQADFAEELYDKDNTSEVDTTVSFYAKNFSDEFLEVSVKLTLIGPVVFKENESEELIISTLKTGMRTVPVTITGYGNIQVIITQNT